MIFDEFLPILNELENEFSREDHIELKNNRHLTFNCVEEYLHRCKHTANIDVGSNGYDPVIKFSIELFFN